MASIGQHAARAGIWLAGFRVVSQALSWAVTIAVARMLTPGDYGLMAMASILTGYVEVFSEMGVGAAIVQRDAVSSGELSSNFWFSVMVGCGFAAGVWGLAYPTVWLFHNEAVIPLTRTISILFILGALMVVPFNVLTREMRFREIGMLQLIAAVLASLTTLWMAYHGYGVWTLLGGVFVLRISTVIMVFIFSGWRPSWHYQFDEVRPFLRFGLGVAGARSLFYCFQKMDRFIVGRVLGEQALGWYSFAMELASLPADKLMSIVNQVSLPLFSKIRRDPAQLVNAYLKVTRCVTLMVAPLFAAGVVFGDVIIQVLLGDQWLPCVFLFRMFCLVQLLVALNSVHGQMVSAIGNPYHQLKLYAVMLLAMGPSLYWAALYGVERMALPWLVVYPLIWLGWTAVTLRGIHVSWRDYWRKGCSPLAWACLAVGFSAAVQHLVAQLGMASSTQRVIFLQEVVVSVVVYGVYLLLREKDVLADLRGVSRGGS